MFAGDGTIMLKKALDEFVGSGYKKIPKGLGKNTPSSTSSSTLN